MNIDNHVAPSLPLSRTPTPFYPNDPHMHDFSSDESDSEQQLLREEEEERQLSLQYGEAAVDVDADFGVDVDAYLHPTNVNPMLKLPKPSTLPQQIIRC